VIRFEHVAKRYPGGVQALSDVNFELERGEMAFLTGHSGAGKSTLLRLIAVLERPSRGQVLFDGKNIGRVSSRQIPKLRRKVGVIFQDHKLLTDRKVLDNVALPLLIAGFSWSEIRRRVRAALDLVGLLDKENTLIPALSGGQQQRVGIARAMIAKPPVLLADEPTGNLDPELSEELMRLFCTLNELGTTVLIATHDLDLVERLGRRTLVLESGCMVDDRNAGSIGADNSEGANS